MSCPQRTHEMFLTRDDRVALQRDQWEREAQALLVNQESYSITPHDAWKLAASLYLSNRDEGGEMMDTPEAAVREELSYWGD